MPWPRHGAFGRHLAYDGNHVRPVQSNRCNTKDADDGGAQEYLAQHCVQWRPSTLIHPGPDLARREELVARKGKDHTCESLHGSKADKLQDDESGDCE